MFLDNGIHIYNLYGDITNNDLITQGKVTFNLRKDKNDKSFDKKFENNCKKINSYGVKLNEVITNTNLYKMPSYKCSNLFYIDSNGKNYHIISFFVYKSLILFYEFKIYFYKYDSNLNKVNSFSENIETYFNNSEAEKFFLYLLHNIEQKYKTSRNVKKKMQISKKDNSPYSQLRNKLLIKCKDNDELSDIADDIIDAFDLDIPDNSEIRESFFENNELVSQDVFDEVKVNQWIKKI